MDNLIDDEASNCPKCDGQGSYDQWKAVAGHYEGGEVFRMTCEHCDGTGRTSAQGWVCNKCGTDRTKAACPKGHQAALTGACPMVGVAQSA